MKTGIIMIVMLAAFLPIVAALDMCKDSIKIDTNCTLLTPSLSCTAYNYSIFNLTGGRVENGSLASLNSTIYYFNFTLPEGDYIIELCDGSTREVSVEEEDSMWYVAVALLLMTGIWFFGRMIFQLDEKHVLMKLFGILITVWFIVGAAALGISFAETNGANAAIINTLGVMYKGFMIAAIAITAYFLIYAGVVQPIMRTNDRLRKKRDLEDEE